MGFLCERTKRKEGWMDVSALSVISATQSINRRIRGPDHSEHKWEAQYEKYLKQKVSGCGSSGKVLA
jgi:hypothetical protein